MAFVKDKCQEKCVDRAAVRWGHDQTLGGHLLHSDQEEDVILRHGDSVASISVVLPQHTGFRSACGIG